MQKITVLNVFFKAIKDGSGNSILVIEADKDFVPQSGKQLVIGEISTPIVGISLNTQPIAPYIPVAGKSYWHLLVALEQLQAEQLKPHMKGRIE
ncbi:MAG: hypothetical protein U0T75_04415 [Chitinophagales bacterium]